MPSPNHSFRPLSPCQVWIYAFIEFGDPMTNYANVQEDDTVATHALAFLLARELCTDMKYIVGYYFTGIYTYL